MKLKKNKIGLALGSGGARGLIHLGILKSLEKHQLEIKHIAGSSIGSLVAAMYASGQSLEKIQEKILADKWDAFKSLLDPGIRGGLVSGKRLEKLISEWIGCTKYSELKIPLTTVSTDLITGDEMRFSSGDLIKTVMASMAVPLLFKPVKYKNHLLVDGGLSNPVPDNCLKEIGATTIISVNLDYRKKSPDDPKKYKWMATILRRSFNIARHHLAAHSMQDSDIIINPEFKNPSTMGLKHFLTKKRAQAMIDRGEKLMDEKIQQHF